MSRVSQTVSRVSQTVSQILVSAFDVTLYAIYLYLWENIICKLYYQQISFLIAKFTPSGENLAINKVTWYVNKSSLFCLVPSDTFCLLYQGQPMLFIFIHWKNRVTNQKEIPCYRVYKIINNASIITISKRPKRLIRMCHIYFLLF